MRQSQGPPGIVGGDAEEFAAEESGSMPVGTRFECAEASIQCQRGKNECSRRESNPSNKLGRLES